MNPSNQQGTPPPKPPLPKPRPRPLTVEALARRMILGILVLVFVPVMAPLYILYRLGKKVEE